MSTLNQLGATTVHPPVFDLTDYTQLIKDSNEGLPPYQT